MTAATAIALNHLDRVPLQRHSVQHSLHNLSERPQGHKATPSLHPKDAMEEAVTYSQKDGKTFPSKNKALSPREMRDQIRARIAKALGMALHEGWINKGNLCAIAQIDRKTLDNWLVGECDPTGWRIAMVGQALGPWFWMHVYGGDIGLAMWNRMKQRIAEASHVDIGTEDIEALEAR